MTLIAKNLSHPLNQNLIFVHGKGGVGKTAVSQAIALSLAKKRKDTLWITLEDPTRPRGELIEVQPHLWHLNCDFTDAFEEYASMKIGVVALTRIFIQNRLMRYLAKAAPGVHELVLLGKIWYERNHYSHVVVDMPSTGYGIAMFQSTVNFSLLFKGGPLQHDAGEMLRTFRDPKSTGHLIVSLPEETPLRESLELKQYLLDLFPDNPPVFIVNRVFPKSLGGTAAKELQSEIQESPDSWPTPFAISAEEYAQKRYLLENYNLRIWRQEGLQFGEISTVPSPLRADSSTDEATPIVKAIAHQLQLKAYL